MHYKKILLSLVFIMFIVGISCVSAEDIDDAGILSTNEIDDDLSVEDSLDDNLNSDESEVLADSSSSPTVTSWSELGGQVSGTTGADTVYIGANLTPSGQIVINHDVTIIGSENTYVGGSSSSNKASYNYIPIYSNANGLSITLKNIKFQNCGGNILMQFNGNGNYNIENCIFENCSATGMRQSIVYLSYGYANIINCTFEKCTTSYGTISNYNAASVNNVHMVVNGTTFKDNTASIEPGAINNCGQLIVDNSTFENNRANWWAGAIHTHNGANTTIMRSKFKNNIAGWNGGALYTYSTLTVIDSNFTGNEAHSNNGGAIAGSSSPKITVMNCNFDENNATTGSGGAIYISGGTLTVDNSRFNNNIATTGSGGAIFASGTTSTITYSEFRYNSAPNGYGGAIYGTGNGRLTVDHCLFINNTAKNDNYGHALAYSYTGSSDTAAYFTYTNNGIYGPNNGIGSVYAANSHLQVFPENNTVEDISNYTEPEDENDTNGTITGNVDIPTGVEVFESSWDISMDGALSGTPVISGNYIIIPATHTLYCYNTVDQSLVWNFTTEYGYFHELLVNGNIVYAPASWDTLYIFNISDGDSLTNNNIYQGSSLFTPIIYNNTIYLSSDYGYGENNNTWITMVKYDSDYYYYGSILEINGITYGNQALLSQPYIYGNTLYVNTVNGLMSYNLINGTTNIIAGTVGNPIIDASGNICILSNNGNTLSLLDSNLNVVSSVALDGACDMLVSDGNGNVYTVDENGYIYYASYTSSSLSCSKTTFPINPITTAMAYYDEQLYIGDNNGILWVFNVDFLDETEINDVCLAWAFDAGSAITGGICVDNDFNVYVGTDNSIYQISI